MKKVYVITLHSILNFGSTFQTLALQDYVKKIGYEVEIINYQPMYTYLGKNVIKTLIGKMLFLKEHISKKRKFDSFISNHLNLTDCYRSENRLKTVYKNDVDSIFITGGDQLWNPFYYCGKDRAYRLTFTNNNNKFAFGTSIGQSYLNSEDLNELVQDLTNYKLIGVREHSSVFMLKQAGLSNVYHVCDPVLLMPEEYYLQFCHNTDTTLKYCLVYLADKCHALDVLVDYIKKTYGYKVIQVCGFRSKIDADITIKNEGPEDVISLIKGAEIVISASFHATLFSILFEKEFYSLLPGENTNERIRALLNYFGLSSRIVNDNNATEVSFDPINYNNVREKKNILIKQSKEYIETIFEESC